MYHSKQTPSVTEEVTDLIVTPLFALLPGKKPKMLHSAVYVYMLKFKIHFSRSSENQLRNTQKGGWEPTCLYRQVGSHPVQTGWLPPTLLCVP